MKICWDNLEGIYRTRRGNLKKGNTIYVYRESCKVCKEPFLVSKYRDSNFCGHICSGVGENNPFFGKTHTKETKKKISNSRKGKCCGDESPTKRKEVREKISHSKQGENHPYYGKRGKQTANWKGGYHTNNIPTYDTYASRLLIAEDVRRCPTNNNILEVKCAYCGKWLTPKIWEVSNRIQFINGKYNLEYRFLDIRSTKN